MGIKKQIQHAAHSVVNRRKVVLIIGLSGEIDEKDSFSMTAALFFEKMSGCLWLQVHPHTERTCLCARNRTTPDFYKCSGAVEHFD